MEYEKELDEVLAAFTRVQINGAQQFEESKRRFLMLMRDDKAATVAALQKPEHKTCHFCAEYQVSPKEMQIFDGVATSNVAVSSPDFYRRIKATIAGAMQPPRPPEKVVLRSLTPLA